MPQRREAIHPTSDVLRAFQAVEEAARVSGGQGQAFRSGNLILKPAVDDERTNWIAEFYLNTSCAGFRLPRPIRSESGHFVHEGWQAWEFIPGEHGKGGWERAVDLCLRFHVAISGVPRPSWFDQLKLDDPWTIADRVTWGELEFEHHPRIAPAVAQLRDCLREIDAESQLIHGDFGGNILYCNDLLPAVIDFSPYWRPAGFAVGIVIADAIVWGDVDMSLIEAGNGIENFDQLLARAELRRVIELDASHQLWGWDMLGELDAHMPLIQAIVERCD